MVELFTNDGYDLTRKLTALEERVEQLAKILAGLEFLAQENYALKEARKSYFTIPERWIKEDFRNFDGDEE